MRISSEQARFPVTEGRTILDAFSQLLSEARYSDGKASALGGTLTLRKELASLLLAFNPVTLFNPSRAGVNLALGTPNRFSNCMIAAERSLAVLADNAPLADKAQLADNAPLHNFGDLVLPQGAVTEGGGGLILHADLVEDPCCPVLCFVNSDAGGGQGAVVKEMLKDFVHPYQIVDVMKADTRPPLRAFAKLPRYRILVAGGDGTAADILSTVQEVHRELNSLGNIPGIGILPIGTGNDLAAALGWGRGFRRRKQLPVFLDKVQRSQPVPIDRWEISINNTATRVFQNYFGIGIDASIANQCDDLRAKYPFLFFNRWLNRKYYGLMGFFDFVRNNCRHFVRDVRIHVDGKELILPPRTKGIVLMNLKSYGGGSQVWFDDELDKFKPASISDGLFEILAIRGPVQLGGVKAGVARPKKVAQGARITIETRTNMPIQADGEPWIQEPCTVTVQRAPESAYMLYPDEPFKGMRQSIKDYFR